MLETEFLSGGRQTAVNRDRMVMFGFVIEIISVKVKREERKRERTKVFETERSQAASILWTPQWSNCFFLCITGVGHGSH